MSKNQIELLTVDHVIAINKIIVANEKQRHVCKDPGKVESALAAAFYPGNYPFQYGGIACVSGALCYFLTKAHAFFDGNKRTAGITAVTFMALNQHSLCYPLNIKTGLNEFADIIDNVAASKITKDQLIKWFDSHKVANEK
jgi:death-on-curing family protein